MGNKDKTRNSPGAVTENKANEKNAKNEVLDELLLNSDDFILTDTNNYDLTNDFVDMLPKKKYQLPDKSLIIKEYDKLLSRDINESLKFNFEKRKSYEKNEK
jgi:hypothetical protein